MNIYTLLKIDIQYPIKALYNKDIMQQQIVHYQKIEKEGNSKLELIGVKNRLYK